MIEMWENESRTARRWSAKRSLTHSLDQREEGLAMQATRICSLTDCDKPISHRTWCEGHYRRWLDHGDPQAGRRSPTGGPCSVDACERPVAARGWCTLHYYRWKRTGLLEVPAPVDPGCAIEDCDRPHGRRGWCKLHYERWLSNGDPMIVLPSARDFAGELSPAWHGDDVTYSGMHIRLRRVRGVAQGLDCVDCGGQAAHWSYDHADPDEVTGTVEGRSVRFSLKTEHYEPRCNRCHTLFDLRKPVTQ